MNAAPARMGAGRPRARSRSSGAVLAMALLFVLFAAGLTLAVAGVGEAIEYRETLQDAADAGALSVAKQYADWMNRLRADAEEELHFVQAAVVFDLLDAAPYWNTNGAGAGTLKLGPCLAGAPTNDCGRWAGQMLGRAAAAAARMRTQAYFNPLFNGQQPAGVGNLGAIRTTHNQRPGQSPGLRFTVADLSVMNIDGLGPGQGPVVRCSAPTGVPNSPTLYDSLFDNPPPDPTQGPVDVYNLWAGDYEANCRANPAVCQNGNQIIGLGLTNPLVQAAIFPMYFQSQHRLFTAGNTNNAAALVGNHLNGRIVGPNRNALCLPTFSRDPERYRVVVRSTAVAAPQNLFTFRRQTVRMGTFGASGGFAAASDDTGFAAFVQAGQFSLAQASFGVMNAVGNHHAFGPGGGANVANDVAEAFRVERGPNPTWSDLPMYLFGDWRANLTRVHFRANRGAIPPPGGTATLSNPAWIMDAETAMVH